MKKYLCGVDYQHEMEEGLADFYDSVDQLKHAKRCWRSCGIVAITLDNSGNELKAEWIHPQDLFGKNGD